MKSKTVVDKSKKADNQRVKRSSHLKGTISKKAEFSPVYAELVGEGYEDFYNYLDWLGLAKKPDLLILTSSHHYYFETEDLKYVKTVVNLKKFNNINSPGDFLKEIYYVLPHKSHFIGCFTDNKKQNIFLSSKKSPTPIAEQSSNTEINTGFWNSFLNMVYDIIDAKTNRYMSEKTVRSLLEDTGFKILDITEFNGLTYFCTQKDNPSVE